VIDLDALKAAGLNSRENSERLLAEHRARQAAELPPVLTLPQRRKDFFAYLESFEKGKVA
jgi:hypothetical protein